MTNQTEQGAALAAAKDALETCIGFIEDAHIIEAQWSWEPVQTAQAALAKIEALPIPTSEGYTSDDPWRQAIDDELIATENCVVDGDDPKTKVRELINWHVTVALDPAVSSAAASLVQRGRLEGYTSVARPAAAGHIAQPYTLDEIEAKIASGDYSAELLLQHAMLLLVSCSVQPGYAVVPKEPTEDMFVAGMEADCLGLPSIDDDSHVRSIWKAMLAATPGDSHAT